MRYIDECCTEVVMELCDFCSHGCTKLGIEVGKRLIKKEYLRVTHYCTTERNTLLLTTGKSLRISVKQVGNIKYAGCFFNLALDCFLRYLAELKTECHIVKNGHMRIQSVVLEHHRNISVLWSDVVYELVADEKLAFRDFLKTCNHTQSSGLTATGRTYEDNKFSIFDFQTKIRNGCNTAGIFLVNMSE